MRAPCTLEFSFSTCPLSEPSFLSPNDNHLASQTVRVEARRRIDHLTQRLPPPRMGRQKTFFPTTSLPC
jgi:hypothetical protein